MPSALQYAFKPRIDDDDSRSASTSALRTNRRTPREEKKFVLDNKPTACGPLIGGKESHAYRCHTLDPRTRASDESRTPLANVALPPGWPERVIQLEMGTPVSQSQVQRHVAPTIAPIARIRDYPARPSSSLETFPTIQNRIGSRPRTASPGSIRPPMTSGSLDTTTTYSPKISSPLNPWLFSDSFPSRPTEPVATTLEFYPTSESADTSSDQVYRHTEGAGSKRAEYTTFETTPSLPIHADPRGPTLLSRKRSHDGSAYHWPRNPASARSPLRQSNGRMPMEPKTLISPPRRPRAHTDLRKGRARFVRTSSIDSGTDADDEKLVPVSNVRKRAFTSKVTEENAIMGRISAKLGTVDSCRPLLTRLRTNGLAQVMVNQCQSVLDDQVISESDFGRNLLVFMQRLSKATGVFPTSCHFKSDSLSLSDEDLVTTGSYGDVYKTCLHGEVVCVKKIRPPTGINVGEEKMCKLRKQLAREGTLWRQLDHPNILPFYGVVQRPVLPCLISPWMENGHILNYLKLYPCANRYLLMNDILLGLDYLHWRNLIHGDLKGVNVLIDSCGRALIADFGLSSVFDLEIPKWDSHSTVASKGGTRRWQAPELFDTTEGDQEAYNTKETDVYAWSCVCYEVFTGRSPFWEQRMSESVVFNVMRGEKPTRPHPNHDAWQKWGLRSEFWSTMDRCWSKVPNQRPTIRELLLGLRHEASHDPRPHPGHRHDSSYLNQAQKPLLDSLKEIDGLLRSVDREG